MAKNASGGRAKKAGESVRGCGVLWRGLPSKKLVCPPRQAGRRRLATEISGDSRTIWEAGIASAKALRQTVLDTARQLQGQPSWNGEKAEWGGRRRGGRGRGGYLRALTQGPISDLGLFPSNLPTWWQEKPQPPNPKVSHPVPQADPRCTASPAPKLVRTNGARFSLLKSLYITMS